MTDLNKPVMTKPKPTRLAHLTDAEWVERIERYERNRARMIASGEIEDWRGLAIPTEPESDLEQDRR